MDNKEYKEKTNEELVKLNTKNLLAYFRAERKRFKKYVAKYTCDCGCDEYYWNLHESYKGIKLIVDNGEMYLYRIKSILATREDVVKNKGKYPHLY